MAFLVSATGHARRQIETVGRWWIANRPKAPELFAVELEEAQHHLAEVPLAGIAFPTPRYPGARRLLMPKTRYHLYYTVHEEVELVLIRAVWHASRGRVPALR